MQLAISAVRERGVQSVSIGQLVFLASLAPEPDHRPYGNVEGSPARIAQGFGCLKHAEQIVAYFSRPSHRAEHDAIQLTRWFVIGEDLVQPRNSIESGAKGRAGLSLIARVELDADQRAHVRFHCFERVQLGPCGSRFQTN
jgi:hypothetical protein